MKKRISDKITREKNGICGARRDKTLTKLGAGRSGVEGHGRVRGDVSHLFLAQVMLHYGFIDPLAHDTRV